MVVVVVNGAVVGTGLAGVDGAVAVRVASLGRDGKRCPGPLLMNPGTLGRTIFSVEPPVILT